MSGFQFKQFYVQHDRCAMKVGTDGVLLGALADIEQADRLLDLGTGSGLVALMLAQRTAAHCQIVAVEVEPQAANQALQNIQRSPWAGKINLEQRDIFDFAGESSQRFDLIVANPPYFQSGVDCSNQQREQARYLGKQSHINWLTCANLCLSERGKIQFILPAAAADHLLEENQRLNEKAQLCKTSLKNTALFCNARLDIMTKPGKSVHRSLLSFQRQANPLQYSTLQIYDQQNRYTEQFIALTRDFYLNF